MKNTLKGEFGLIDGARSEGRKSGRVIHEGGRGVWEWQTSTGVFTRDVSDDHLTRLEISDLQVVEPPPTAVQDPMLKALDRLATKGTPNAKSKVVVPPRAKGTLKGFLKKWVG